MDRRKFLTSAAVLGGGFLLPPPARETRPYRFGEKVSGDVFFIEAVRGVTAALDEALSR